MGNDEGQPEPCQGKCDGLSSAFKDLFSDMTKVDLGDLVNLGAKLATDQINNQLGNIPYAQIELEPTTLYALSHKAQNDLTLKNIESLTAGLAARYGDDAFVTRINKLRVDYLKQHPDRVFAESSFELGAALSPHLSFEAGGLPGRVGFLGSKGVRTTVVAPVKELSGVVTGPVKALKALRGFVLPRSLTDMQQMKPGESVSLQSEGTVGFNIGVGLPIYVTTIASYATIHAVFSAGARATLTGVLDIQLIRDDGDKVIVDVGVTDQTARSMNVGVKSRWGIEGLPEFKLKVGSLDLDATSLAENALEDLLNKRLALFQAGFAAGKDHSRHTIARFSFNLAQQDQAMEQAIVQALKGDIRLAQALSHRKTPGVSQLLDFARDKTTLSRYFGVNILSLSFFNQKKDTKGSAVITVGPNSQQLLFNEIDRQKGAFTSTEGYKRRTVVSLKSVDGRLVDADFNLHLQLRDNKTRGAGQILGHVDPLLSLFLGKERLVKRLEPYTRSLRYYIQHKCPEPMDNKSPEEQEYKKCLESLASDPQVAAKKAQARAAFAKLLSEGIQGGLDAKYDDAKTFAQKLFDLKLAVQGNTGNPDEPWRSPKADLVFDYRLTEKAVTSLLAAPDAEQRFVQTLYDVLSILDPSFEGQLGKEPPWDYNHFGNDDDPPPPPCVVLKDVMNRTTPVFVKYANRYKRYVNLSNESYQSKVMGHTTLGESAHLLVVKDKKEMSMASIAEGKAKNTAKLFDNLVSKLGWTSDFWETAHEVIGYALLTATHPSQTELLVDFDFKKEGDVDFPEVQLYGRGENAKLIDAGQFDLDALIGK